MTGRLAWRKAGACTGTATCVEAAPLPEGEAVLYPGGAVMRDGKNPDGGELPFEPEVWRALTDMAKAGELGE
jgi:Domain of unknown function (DUF397)